MRGENDCGGAGEGLHPTWWNTHHLFPVVTPCMKRLGLWLQQRSIPSTDSTYFSRPSHTTTWNSKNLTFPKTRGKSVPTYQSRGLHFSRNTSFNSYRLVYWGASKNAALKQMSSMEIIINFFPFCSGSDKTTRALQMQKEWRVKISHMLSFVYHSLSLLSCTLIISD